VILTVCPVKQVVWLVVELLCVIWPALVYTRVVVDAEEAALICLDGAAGRDEETVAALFNSIAAWKLKHKTYVSFLLSYGCANTFLRNIIHTEATTLKI
jgi:hypothetical protein